jgi:hypothetical protein
VFRAAVPYSRMVMIGLEARLERRQDERSRHPRWIAARAGLNVRREHDEDEAGHR